MKSCQKFSLFLEESAFKLRSSFQLKESSQLEREEKLVSLMYEHYINYLAYTI